MAKKREQTIYLDHYIQETTDPNEVREARANGPLHPSGDGERIPHTGYVDANGVRFTLSGFGKRDTPKAIKPIIAPEMTEYLKKFLGKAYMYNFAGKPEVMAATATAINLIGEEAFKQKLRSFPPDFGSLKALEVTLGLREAPVPVPQDRIEPTVERPRRASSIGDDPD